MSNTKKNLGHVTAYAYYKAGGGTMTEAEFTEYMAQFGDAAERAVDAASEAAQSKADAETAATSATNSAAAALTSEENANGAMLSAYSDANRANTAADTATSAKNDAVSAKNAAVSAKTAAETAASTATTKATAAANSATAAAGSATAAANSATEAATTAQGISEHLDQIDENTDAIDALKEDLKSATVKNYTEYPFTITNSRISPSSGEPVYNNNSYRTDYIECSAGQEIEYKGRSAWYQGSPIAALLSFYKADKTFISSIATFSDTESTNTTGSLSVTAPANTAYVIAGTYTIVDDSYFRIKNVEELIQKIPEILGDIDGLENTSELIGYYTNTFPVTASTAHSSQNDKLPVDIKQGEQFTVAVSGVATGGQVYGYYNNLASNVRLSTTLSYSGIASQNFEAIGVYFENTDVPSSGNVTVTVYKNNYIYGKTQRIPDEKNIVTTVLGAELPNDVAEFGVTSGYASKMKEAIDGWMAYYAGDDTIIPFIVHTDQHGRLTANTQGVFNLVDYLVNWGSISAIFNLGDTIVDHWENDDTNTNPLLRNAELEAARVCLANIPKEKRIDVYGNHDTWYFGSLTTAVSGTLPSLKYLNPYFLSDGLVTKKLPDNSGLEVVYDNKRNVKYLVLAGWDYADKAGQYVGYQWYWINQDHLNWMVKEMTKNDGYDLVLVSHVPLQMGDTGCVDPITGSSITETVPWYITHYDPYLIPLWNARKNKTNGTVSSNGVSVAYDFRNCETDCLCALSGHTHYDGIQYLSMSNDDNGLLNTSFDWFQNQTIHFGVIDRVARKIKVWKLANDSNTPTVDTWEMPFDKESS